MSEFLNILQNLNPDIESSQADELRAVFVALSQQTENVEDSTTWSLNRWLQWLDDEGFDRTALMGTLNSLGIAATGQQAWDHLSANLRTHMEDTDGLALLQEMVEREDPELLARLHTLETVALREHLTLAQTAGGLSKVVKDSLYGVGGVVLVAGFVGAYKVWKNRRRLQAEAADAAKKDTEKTVREFEHIYDEIQFKVEKQYGDKGTSVAKILYWNKVEDDVMSRPAREDLRLVRDNEKPILDYTTADIENRAKKLALDHVENYFDKQVEKAFEDYFIKEKLPDLIKKHPGYDQHVKEIAGRDAAYANLGEGDEIYDNAAIQLREGDWYKSTSEELRQAGIAKQKLDFEERAKQAYKTMITAEVSTAKEAAKREDYVVVDDAETEAKEVFKYSKVKIDREVVKAFDDVKSAVRNAEKTAERELRDSEMLM